MDQQPKNLGSEIREGPKWPNYRLGPVQDEIPPDAKVRGRGLDEGLLRDVSYRSGVGGKTVRMEGVVCVSCMCEVLDPGVDTTGETVET